MLWLHDHHFSRWFEFHKFGTTSDALIKLGEDDSDHSPPFSLASRRGQLAGVVANAQMLAWKNDIPYMAFLLREELHAAVEGLRETKTRAVAHALVEVILTKAAYERTGSVMLGFEIAQTGVKALTGEQTNFRTLGRLLVRLAASKSVVVEFGERGVFRKTTKVRLTFVTHSRRIERLAEKSQGLVNDWLMEYGHWTVRAEKHQRHLRQTLAERKAEWAAATTGADPEVEAWIMANTVQVSRRRMQVDLPGSKGDLLTMK